MTREGNVLFSSVNSPILPSLLYSVRPNKHVYVGVIYFIYSVSNLKSNNEGIGYIYIHIETLS